MQKNTDNMKKVVSATDIIEAGMFVNLLKNNGIPAYTVDKESGDYLKVYMGYTVYGVDIFVNEKDYDQAFTLLSEVTFPDQPQEPEMEETQDTREEEAEEAEAEEQEELPFSPLLVERQTAARIIIAAAVGLPCLIVLLLFLQSFLNIFMRRVPL